MFSVCCVFRNDRETLLFLIVPLAALIWFKAESVSFQLDLGGEGHNGASYNLFTLKCESKTLGIGTHMEMGAPVQSQKGSSFNEPSLTGAGITHLLRGSRRPTVARGTKPARANIYLLPYKPGAVLRGPADTSLG